ncbi:hypothetical protein NUSPORA_00633 [Nucleospora cyclopteri]
MPSLINNYKISIIDIAVNHSYFNKNNKLEQITLTAINNGILPVFVGLNEETSKSAVENAEKYGCYCYVGIHPNDVISDQITFNEDFFTSLISNTKQVIAIGECGLDYYRIKQTLIQTNIDTGIDKSIKETNINTNKQNNNINKSIKETNNNTNKQNTNTNKQNTNKQNNNTNKQTTNNNIKQSLRKQTLMQIEIFRKQLLFGKKLKLPFFLHLRDLEGSNEAFIEFIKLINEVGGIKGVIHSFDGSIDNALKLIEMGFFIGINGCSMKNDLEMVKHIPIEKILIETDSPFCMIRKKYKAAEYVQLIKAKENKPEFVSNILEAVSKIKNIDIEELKERILQNTIECFNINIKH